MDPQAEQDEIRKLIEADVRVKALTKAIQDETAAILKQDSQLRALGATQQAIDAAWSKATANILAHQQQLAASQKVLADSTGKMGMGFLYASNAIQDFQAAGLRGVVNNIPQIIAAFGGSAGLAGAVQVAAVAIQALEPAFAKLYEAMSPERVDRWASAMEKAAKRIEELKKEDVLTAADAFELRGLEGQVAANQRGEAAWKRQPKFTPGQRAAGDAGLEALANSPNWESARDKMRRSLVQQLGEEAAAAAEASIRQTESQRSMLGTAWQDIKGMFTGDTPDRGGTEARIRKAIENARQTARTNANKDAETQLGKLLDDAQTGDPEALKRLAAKLRESGNDQLAAQLEEQAALAKLKAEPVGPPDLMKEVRDSQEEADNEEYDAETARFEHGNALWRQKKADRAEKDRRRMAAFERARPDWNADTDEMALMRSMAMGVDDQQVRLNRGAAARMSDNALLARGSRWRTSPGGIFETRSIHRAASLEDASKQLEERRYEALVAQGVDRSTAREEAKRYGERAYGAQMQRGYDAWRQLGEMQMTGQLGRGVQVMGAESYVNSVQTAREGIDKQMLDLSKKQTEAMVFLKEWARVNGVMARVSRRKAP